MKIAVFDVREDETNALRNAAASCGVDEMILTAEPLTVGTLSLAEGACGVSVLGHSRLDREMLQLLAANGITACSTRTIGYNHIDLAAARTYGIRVSNARYSPCGVADYTVMLMLMVLRYYKPALYRINVNDYSLDGLIGRELGNLCVGVIGAGNIGQAVIRNLTGFGCRILVYDPHGERRARELFRGALEIPLRERVRFVSLEALYAQSDLISLHIPLTEDTREIINHDSLSLMQDGVILINCARGELMNIPDVTDGIENKKIGGLGLDVFENESGIYHVDRRNDIIKNREMAYLRQFPNVVMTQHMAFYTQEAVENMARCGMEGLAALIRGDQYIHELT